MGIGKRICVAFFLPVGTWAQGGFMPETELVPEKKWRLSLKGHHMESLSVFDENGEERELGEGESFAKNDLDIELSYGWGKKLEFSLGGRLRYLDAAKGGDSWSESGPERFWVGIKIPLIRRAFWSLSVEGRYASTFYEREENAEDHILGDAGPEATGLGHFSYKHGTGTTLTLTAGHRTRADHLSGEIPYRAAINLHGKKSWAFSLGASGIHSLEGDEYTDNLEGRPRVVQGTYQFNGLNRSHIRPFVGASYSFPIWKIGLEGGAITGGVSTDKSVDLLLSLTRFMGEGVSSVERKISSFKTYAMESSVTRVSPRGLFIVIDRGLAQGMEEGVKIDIFKTDYSGENILYATGVVYEAKGDSSIVKLIKRFVHEEVEVGFTARSQ